jgi:mRNA interferase RelE/StbE
MILQTIVLCKEILIGCDAQRYQLQFSFGTIAQGQRCDYRRDCAARRLRMTYEIEFKPRALKDLKVLPKHAQRRIMARIDGLSGDLAGDVKKLTNFSPEYRLRVGDYRVLFEVEGEKVLIYRVIHRKDAY